MSLRSSPYDPVEFDYSVHNDARWGDYAYLEPDGLPYGMKLTVTPRGQTVPPKSTVIFRCKLEFDDAVLSAGCHSDRQFRIVTWRREPESTTLWGGVQYKVMPRKRCAVTLTGWWGMDGIVHLSGQVTPDPGGGVLRLRLAPSPQRTRCGRRWRLLLAGRTHRRRNPHERGGLPSSRPRRQSNDTRRGFATVEIALPTFELNWRPVSPEQAHSVDGSTQIPAVEPTMC